MDTTTNSTADRSERGDRGPRSPIQTAAEDRVRLHVLTTAQCLELLRAGQVGRVVVVSASGRPLIRPVNYKFDEASGSIVFRSRRGSKLHALAHADHACFEIDGGDQGPKAAWSVIITGRVEHVTAPAEVARLERLGLVTWIATEPVAWLRIRANVISGRRLGRCERIQ